MVAEAITYWCEHPETELRWRINRAGQGSWVRQCLTCGGQHGPAVSRNAPEVRNLKERTPFDDSIAERYEDLRRARLLREQRLRDLQKEQKQREWWTWYDRYLMTPEWKARRALVLKRANGLCEGCREHRATQVHHTTYAHVGNEFLFELVALCNECHERYHEEKADR